MTKENIEMVNELTGEENVITTGSAKTDFDVSCKISQELISQLTEQCRALGYHRKMLLGYIFDNKELYTEICQRVNEDFFQIQMEVNKNIKTLGLKETGVTIHSDGSLKRYAKYNYGITRTMFLHYLITRDVIKDYADRYPQELKMKKVLKEEKRKAKAESKN